MDGEENLHNFPIRDLGRIEAYLDPLSVTSLASADLLVGRIDGGAARVAGNHILDAVNFQEYRLNTPETTAGEGSNFQ